MDVKKLEVPKMDKQNILEIIEEMKHCAYTYIEDEADEENIKAYTVLGITRKLIENLNINTLDKILDEFIKDVEVSNTEVFKKYK